MQQPVEILKQYWGYDSFRSPQEDIIRRVLDGHDALALLPTGGGKSICFQVPGLCLGGLTLVISPLVALMKDQVHKLLSLDIPATYLTGELSPYQIDRRLQGAMDGQYRFLYMAPERIDTEIFLARLDRMPLSLIAVDEAHCISQWGYDFRPSYLEISKIREHRPEVPMLALTASATHEVEADIISQLELRDVEVFRKSFARDNLRYFVLPEENVVPRITEICRRTQGTGIVYVRTRKLTKALAEHLVANGVSAKAYHGGMLHSERSQVQEEWISDNCRVMVATNAFGMGIDKPDVRFVVHHNLPFDLESYYQEAGRGGRDGKTALAIAFDNPIDQAEMQRWSADRYPTWEQLQRHYQELCNYFRVPNQGMNKATHVLDIAELARSLDTPPRKLYASLKVLHQEGLVHFTEDREDYAYIQVTASPDALHRYKSNWPRSVDLLDHLLRSFGGKAYTEEVPFLPRQWAMRFGWDMEELNRRMQRLMEHEVLSFRPAFNEPTLAFLQPRHVLTQKEINWEKYEFLKQRNRQRLEEMLSYVKETKVCRSLMIQQYFGEKAHQPCGRCDVCIGRTRTKVSDTEYTFLQNAILAYISGNRVSYRDVLDKMKDGTPAQREKVLRYLIDKELVMVGVGGALVRMERR